MQHKKRHFIKAFLTLSPYVMLLKCDVTVNLKVHGV